MNIEIFNRMNQGDIVVTKDDILTDTLDLSVPEDSTNAFTVKLLIAVSGTTIVWLVATFVTKPETMETLYNFYQKTHPGGPGWKKVVAQAASEGRNINEAEEGQAW